MWQPITEIMSGSPDNYLSFVGGSCHSSDMGFVTDDGLHEGYLVPQFFDGQRAAGITGGTLADDQVASGSEFQLPDGTWSIPSRPAGEVTGWVLCCDCYAKSGHNPVTWVGPVFTRVPSKLLEDIGQRKIYAVDEDVAYVSDRPDVEQAVMDLWRSEHAFSMDALAEVEAASEAAAAARRRLDTAVSLARHGGASWVAIGKAAGMTRQSAQERWKSIDGGAE